MGEIFDGPSRLDEHFEITAAVQAKVLMNDEVAEFSEDMQSVIAFLVRELAIGHGPQR